MSRATQSKLLEARISENVAAQEIDLATWIFERVAVRPGDQVLELCCGTGGQTLTLLDRVGQNGRVIGLDLSRAALETLASKAQSKYSKTLHCVEGRLEDFSSSLERAGLPTEGFDLVFCAYGLYYSSDAERTLNEARATLKANGRIVIVGPFGPNNKPLFDIVTASGIELSEAVVYSSGRFMLQMVLPWAAQNFETTAVHTMVNRVRWSSPERVLNYWRNTTFYDATKGEGFEQLLGLHFERYPMFINEKWVMLVEMGHGRT